LRAFTVLSYTVTAGAVADTTAADEMEAVYPPPENCPTDRSVVLATDSNFPDALSASYLAGQLKTGILLTPTATLSPDAANALREEGINNVYVVGGLDVVSQAVINTITSTPVYACGGTTLDPSDTTISEQTISGQTLYDTSEDIADFFLSSMVGKAAFPGAYGGSGGNGAFNDTTGISSATGPTSPVPTAIVATGAGFQDATVASVVGYSEHFPVILTTPTTLATQAQDALINDKIQQVILVGGEDAVSDAVVTQMEDLGISVLRVAGQDYTDTAVQLAYFELDNIPNTVGATGLGWDQDNDNQVTMARGDFYTDALAGAPFAALIADGHPQPILTTEDPSTLGTYLTGFLNLVGSDTGIFFEGPDSQVFTINVLGGQYAVNPTTISDALTALEAG
jgi:putative cell wall-binding protein